jgi:uncharacterized protein
MGDSAFLKGLRAHDYTDAQFGLPTVTDIIKELDKPGRDPRPEFKTATFVEGVEKISDLEIGMILEGVVSNVANFGAFIDIGVHQDGLVHISALTDRFVSDPREIVKAGDIVKVKVMEVDVQRKRIALSMRLNDEPGEQQSRTPANKSRDNSTRSNNAPRNRNQASRPNQNNNLGGAMADAFAKAKR